MIRRICDALVDRAIRSKAALHDTPLDKYRVVIAREVSEYEDAFHLLHIAYAFQGIESIRSHGMRITPQHVLPEATVFVAYEGNQCVGTMTVTLDSPAGLPLEKDYAGEIDSLRSTGARVVEYGSLAVVRRCWSTGATVLLNMAASYWSINMLDATDIVIGINPKATAVYRALYDFRPLGAEKRHSELAAPVAAMRCNLPGCLAFSRKHHTRPLSSGLMFHEHCCSRLPDCIEIPAAVPQHELIRWKLPRSVFQELFIEKSNRLDSLDMDTRRYLGRWRTETTLHADAEPDKAPCVRLTQTREDPQNTDTFRVVA